MILSRRQTFYKWNPVLKEGQSSLNFNPPKLQSDRSKCTFGQVKPIFNVDLSPHAKSCYTMTGITIQYLYVFIILTHRPIPSNYGVMKIASWQLNSTAKFHFSEIVFWQSKLILNDISTKYNVVMILWLSTLKWNIKKIFCPKVQNIKGHICVPWYLAFFWTKYFLNISC